MEYPLVLIPENIKDAFEREVTDKEIIEHLGFTYPELNLELKLKYQRDFYGHLNDEKEISKLENSQFAKLIQKNWLKTVYEICYTISEQKYLNGEYNFGEVYIGGKVLPSAPEKTVTTTTERKDYGCLTTLIVISIIILIFISKLGLAALIFTSCMFAFGIYLLHTNSMPIVEKVESQKSDEHYEIELKEFKRKIEAIKNQVIEQYNKEYASAKSIAKEYRATAEREIFLKAIKPNISFAKTTQNSNRGKTEIYFLEKLHSKFGDQIQVDLFPETGKNPFQPDFLFLCNQTGICIDIEIDEPYSVDNGKPIHHDRSNDSIRNEYFTDLNVIVVRFSERQVIEHPQECVDLINQIRISFIEQSHFEYYHNVPRENLWTYEQSLIYANTNYRNTYLPNGMKVTIKITPVKKQSNSFEDFDDLPF
jgi:hypothetical protein